MMVFGVINFSLEVFLDRAHEHVVEALVLLLLVAVEEN